MKKDGFVSTAMAYTFLIVFAFLLLTIIKSYNNNIPLSDEIKNRAKDDLIYSYTYFSPGSCTTYTVPSQGNYRIELWGADGGSANNGLIQGGHGAYTVGTIENLSSGDNLYFCVGKKGTVTAGGDNGGGNGASFSAGGGGATDVRFASNNLNSRIMVAGGGGGASYSSTASGVGGNAGGLTGTSGFNGKTFNTTGCTAAAGTQTSGYSFGVGSAGTNAAAGGGGGYWGGYGSSSASCGGTGGSSYISGHNGTIAIVSSSDNSPRTTANGGSVPCNIENASSNIYCSVHYSGKYFVDTKMEYADPQRNKNIIPIPVYGTGNYSYGDGSARIYKVE